MPEILMKEHVSWIKRVPDHAWGAGFFLLLGLIGAAWRSTQLVEGLFSQNWPTTQGVITESGIWTTYDSDGDPSYKVEIAYEYVVDGVGYVRDRISAAGTFSSGNRHSAEQVMLQYRKGDEVLVAYNPRNPARAVLIPGTQGATWQGVIIFGLFAVAGALWMGVTLRNHKLRTGV